MSVIENQELIGRIELKEIDNNVFIDFGMLTSYLLTKFGEWIINPHNDLLREKSINVGFLLVENYLIMNAYHAIQFGEFLGEEVADCVTNLILLDSESEIE